jgi:diguanylate cyclase (GGDEF)-like protein
MNLNTGMALLRRALLGILFMLFAPIEDTAQASEASRIDEHGCAFYAPLGADPRVVIATAPPPCNKAIEEPDGRVSYVLFTGLSARTQPGDPLEFSFREARAEFQQVYFRYADGLIIPARVERDQALRPLSSNDLYFPVPYRPVALAAVLVQAKGYENAVGLATRPRLAPRSANMALAAKHHLAYGLFGGAIVAILLYNLMLWRALRYRFIMTYCLLGVTMLLFGVSWSGLIFWIVPGLTINGQIALNFLAYALIIATVPLFLFSFVEAKAIPAPLKSVTLVTGQIAVIASLLRLIGLDSIWQLLDAVTYGGILLTLALIAVSIGYALARRSLAVRYFIIAWTIPLGFAAYRTLWGVGLINSDGPIMDVSPFGVMALEMVLSALGIAARIHVLRDERDDAQAMRAMLQHLADTDPLTGLHNRRAFLERAHSREGMQRLILIDIDRFKTVNDRFGHEAGDWVLVEIARLLRTNAPEDALVGRLGGEEFAILAPVDGCPQRLGETLLLTIAYAPMPVRSKVTASAGEALGTCVTEAEWRALYNSADAALYAAKADGRNCLRREAAAA